jgi:hypothetical protein
MKKEHYRVSQKSQNENTAADRQPKISGQSATLDDRLSRRYVPRKWTLADSSRRVARY